MLQNNGECKPATKIEKLRTFNQQYFDSSLIFCNSKYNTRGGQQLHNQSVHIDQNYSQTIPNVTEAIPKILEISLE